MSGPLVCRAKDKNKKNVLVEITYLTFFDMG